MSRRLLSIVLSAAMLLAAMGCSCRSDFENELESLWRSGYGFNNPNTVERMQKGLPSLGLWD